MNADKSRIKQRFAQALASYEAAAQVQAVVADTLLDELATCQPGLAPGRVLEIGCASGVLTEKIVARYPRLVELLACDLVEDCAACLNTRSANWPLKPGFLAGDIEELALPGCFDLILSSSTLQWVHDLPALAAKLADHLEPGGLLAVALYGPDNFLEIRTLTGRGLPYLSLAELRALMARHFQILATREDREPLYFANPLDLLRHLRNTGVNALTPPGWTRGKLSRFCAEYQSNFGSAKGVRLTYHPLYLVARKAGQETL